jgi:hypothetical protein
LAIASRDAWLAEANQALANGKTVIFGNLQITPKGVQQGNNFAEWKAVVETKTVNQEGVIGIVWNNPSKKKLQTMSVRLGFKGNVLMQLVNNKIQ